MWGKEREEEEEEEESGWEGREGESLSEDIRTGKGPLSTEKWLDCVQ